MYIYCSLSNEVAIKSMMCPITVQITWFIFTFPLPLVLPLLSHHL